MKERDIRMILQAITEPKSFNYWGADEIRAYARKLKEKEPQIPLTYNREIYKANVVQWVKDHDPALQEFLKINQRFESERTKTTTLYRFDSPQSASLRELLRKFKPMQYDPHGAGTWKDPKLVFAGESQKEIVLWYAIKAERHFHEEIDLELLGSKVREKIEETIKAANPNYESLEELTARYSVHSRIINTIKIEKQSGNVLFSTDQPKLIDPDLDEKRFIEPETRLEDFIGQSLALLGTSNPDKVEAELKQNRRISQESLERIRAIDEKDRIMIPYKHEQRFSNGELSERNKNEFENFTTASIRKAVADYFSSKGTFKGFFREHSNLNAEQSGHIIKALTSDEDIVRVATGFYFCVANSEGRVEISKVYVNSALGTLKVASEKGGEQNDRLYEELDRVFS